MCLRRCESSSLGRFAELFLMCLALSAADVPCKTAPFASFSGRTEKEGPSRPERGPIYEIVLVHFDKTICLFRHAEGRRSSPALSKLFDMPIRSERAGVIRPRQMPHRKGDALMDEFAPAQIVVRGQLADEFELVRF